MDPGMNVSEDDLALVHAEVDGELTAERRSELHRRLLAKPSLRALREQLRRTCAALDALPLEEAPPDLLPSIMESLPAPAPGRLDRDVHPTGGRSRPWLRHAAVLAGGLFVTALAFQFAVTPHGPDAGELAGTIAGLAGQTELELRLEGVSGIVRAERRPTGAVVVVELEASRPVQVIARLGREERRLAVPAATQHGRTHEMAVFSRSAGSGAGGLRVEVVDTASGRILQSATLRPTVPVSK